VFGVPRSPWRTTHQAATDDAIRLGLASWDASEGAHFLAVPVDLVARAPDDPRIGP
jgi:hypothetical protein